VKTHIFYLVIGLLMINTLSGQVKIGDNPQTLHPASVLELESSTRALVITRVSNIEMNSITPLAGALVYNTDEDCLHYYNGTEWINICETLDNSFTVSTLALHNVTSQDSTVVITQEDTPDGINYNYEVNKIGSDNITNFSVLNSHIAVETITNDKIQNGTITNAKLDKLSIPLSGFGTPLTDVSMGNAARLTNLQNPTAPQDAATKSYVDNLADDDITAVTFNPANNRLTVNEGTTSFFTDLSPLEESADILANTTAINNHITNDNDTDPNNENQTVSAGTGISINQVGDDFEVTNTAPDQTVSLADGGSGNVTIGGTYPNLTIDVPSLNDNDSDPNNENQTVSAGTGISVNQVGDDFEVTNTAPDQTVSLADGGNGNVTIGGTYPNLTIDVPDDTNTLYTAGIGLTATGGGTIFNVDNLAGDVTGPTSATVIADGVITSAKILDGTITNADINSGAAIDGSKISPVFTTDVTTTGDFIDLTPDFVFEKYFNGFSNLNNEYRFRSLEEVEAFVKENNHLPGIRSAYEIKESGQYRLTESSLAHLEKIEELFLHTIEQEKKIEQLQADNQKLSSELDSLKADMEKIKALLSTKTLD